MLDWKTIEDKVKESAVGLERFDPFKESKEAGGRRKMLDTVMSLLRDNSFHDAIVIQGPAGSGKSAFTLRLCSELIECGLKPIRIELKHLDVGSNKAIDERLPESVRLGDRDYDKYMAAYSFDGDLFDGNRIFTRGVKFGSAQISQYVLILDAWDEVSIGASVGYQEQINDLLERVRSRYLDPSKRNVDVRVVICGRPSDAIGRAGFMRDATKVLTVRPMRPNTFESLVRLTGIAVKSKPISIEERSPWNLADIQGEIPTLFERYREHFERGVSEDTFLENRGQTLEILGLPLLAQLSLRLLAHWNTDVDKILDNTTVLYRSLVDLVIDAGKPPETNHETMKSAQLRGREHRELLRRTATAITLIGQEHISYDELDRRLSDDNIDLEKVVEIDDENLLSKLMISFFFKGGLRELGCEFSHKSFREYLFAENVVELLKEFGRSCGEIKVRADDSHWIDFSKDDPRYELSHKLAFALGPKWLTHEVADHITNLIEWEVLRTFGTDPYPVVGIDDDPIGHTEQLTTEQWKRARDGLADLWNWWAEGIPMRPQPYHEKTGNRGIVFEKTLLVEIAERDVSLSRLGRKDPLPRTTRVYSIDAHLGRRAAATVLRCASLDSDSELATKESSRLGQCHRTWQRSPQVPNCDRGISSFCAQQRP